MRIATTKKNLVVEIKLQKMLNILSKKCQKCENCIIAMI